ncbi:putative reverse transcriptase domain-containing protein [Tanacetum coccineum]|uniref:ATP synthase protein MI25 n=1 Tax=Tanacetum coccineum TaxID=301880 RepID=A0ABQ5HU48_9ASTR
MARSVPTYKKTVQAFLCRNLNVKSATLPNATSSRRNHLQDDLVIDFHFSVRERFVPGSTLKASLYTVMSDFEDSTVTYTEVSSPFEDLSNIGSPGVVGPEYEGLPWMLDDLYVQVILQAPPSSDYVPGPEEPEQALPLPVYVFLAEEQPLPTALSPITDTPGYIADLDPEEDPEEDPTNYPADRGDDDYDEDESSDDDEDDVDIEEDEGGGGETESFETDESAATTAPHSIYSVIARISIRPQTPVLLPSDTEIPSPPLPVLPPPPASPTYPLGYRAAMIRLRVEALSTSHSPSPHIILSHTRADTPPSDTPPLGTPPLLPIPLPTSSPPLHLLSTDHRADRPEVTLLPRKRLGIALGSRYEVGESSSAPTARPPGGFRADYGFVSTMNMEIMRDLERDVEFATRVRQDTEEIYVRLDDEQTERQLMAGWLNMLYRDRHAHARTTLLMKREARMSREAWGRSMDASNLVLGFLI